MKTTNVQTREAKLAKLQLELNEWEEGHNINKPHGFLCECNFGGMLLFIDKYGDSVAYYSDWAGDAVSNELGTAEIEYLINPDNDGDNNLEPGFIVVVGDGNEDITYFLSEFMRTGF